MVQAATQEFGKKNCELGPDDIKRICDALLMHEEGEHSKIFPNEAFGYWKVTVERPLRLSVALTEAALRRFRKACIEASEEPLVAVVEDIAVKIGAGPHADFNRLVEWLEAAAENRGVRVTAKRQKLLMTALGSKDQNAAPVIKKMGKPK